MIYHKIKEKMLKGKALKYVALGLLFSLGGFLILFNSCKNKHLGKITYIDAGVTKNYLIKIPNGYMLIDTSYNNLYDKFIENLAKLNIELSEIKYCFLTHHHDDHSGFISKLMKNSNVEIVAHKNSIKFLSMGKAGSTMKPLNFCTEMAFKLFTFFIKKEKDHKFPPVDMRLKDYIVIGDDDTIVKSFGMEGQIIYTPGHTDDSITLLMDDGRAFVGDLAMDILGVCGCNYRPIYANDIKLVLNSWEKLIKKGAKIIYPSHGDPFDVGHLVVALKKYKKDLFK